MPADPSSCVSGDVATDLCNDMSTRPTASPPDADEGMNGDVLARLRALAAVYCSRDTTGC